MQRFSDWKNDPWRNVDASCLPAMKSWVRNSLLEKLKSRLDVSDNDSDDGDGCAFPLRGN